MHSFIHISRSRRRTNFCYTDMLPNPNALLNDDQDFVGQLSDALASINNPSNGEKSSVYAFQVNQEPK